MNISSETLQNAINYLIRGITDEEFRVIVENHRISDPEIIAAVEAEIFTQRSPIWEAEFMVELDSRCVYGELPLEEVAPLISAADYEDLALAA